VLIIIISGVVGCRHSVSVNVLLINLCALTCYALGSTTNGSAKTSGASHTVNGYLIFILYSVAVLACTSSLFSNTSFFDLIFFFSCSLCGINAVHDHPDVRWRVRVDFVVAEVFFFLETWGFGRRDDL
jgi:hypothetical protein